MEDKYCDTLSTIRQFTNMTNRNDKEDVKRTSNYLEWLKLKTQLVQNEKAFVLTNEINESIRRSNVVWCHFGFNIGSEFGGHHPAIVIRKMGEALYVIPLDSGKVPIDKKDKDYYIDVPFVYEYQIMPRHCNIYNMVKVDWGRIDFNAKIGRVKGKIMDKISDALKKYKIY